jgi:hypothetical protein
LSKVQEKYQNKILGYADDHSFYGHFSPNDTYGEDQTFEDLENCLRDVRRWMERNRLKMNDEKTELIIFGSSKQTTKVERTYIRVGASDVMANECVKYLGVWLDSQMTLEKHVLEKCRIASYNLHNIQRIRKYLTMDTCRTIVQAMVISHIDYANSLLFGLPETTIKHLQNIQNWAAKLILRRSKYDSNTEALKYLHWLPVRKRIDYKLLTLVHKILYGEAPSYLKQLLQVSHQSRVTRSSFHLNLIVPRTKTTFGDRAFSVCSPRLWNNLPNSMKKISEFKSFKKALKTHLFKEHYG